MLTDSERVILEHLRLAREDLAALTAKDVKPGMPPRVDLDVQAAVASIEDAERAVFARGGRRDADNVKQAEHLEGELARLETATEAAKPKPGKSPK